ncbi:MAG: DNA-directed RNA polymerase, partial [Nanoarchaeota archaeon]
EDVKEAVLRQLKNQYEGFISKDIGIVVDIMDVGDVEEGIVIPGDGAAYYEVSFSVLSFKLELQEVLLGKIRDITDFGAFVTLGPVEGMIHISQTMDDFVSFAKDKVLQGKQSSKTLKPEEIVRARMIAISYKDISNPKFGLTMRQDGLGKLEWVKENMAGKKKAKS